MVVKPHHGAMMNNLNQLFPNTKIIKRFLTGALCFAFVFKAMAYQPEVAPRCIDNICLGQLPSQLDEYPESAVGQEQRKKWRDSIAKYPVCFQNNELVETFISDKGRKVVVRFYPYIAKEGEQYRIGQIRTFQQIKMLKEQVREVFDAKKTSDMKEIKNRVYGDYVAVANNGTTLSVSYDEKWTLHLTLEFQALRPSDNGKFMAQPGCAQTTPKF